MSTKKEITRIGLYARKSKFTGKGESIQNQIDACKTYITDHFQEEEWEIFEYVDEGISGKDIENRPEMKRLLNDINNNAIDVLICYRLDRVSRSVRDFSDLIQNLTEQGKEFVSVTESFDTRTPMGRAMIMIASVFSQLERETIAERITDNMYALAKTGRWLGGATPLGYESKKIVEEDRIGKKRSHFRLVEISEELDLICLIYQKYCEFKSLTKLESYLMNAGYRTKNGKFYGRYVLKAILQNPVYCIADRKVYDYMQENNYGIYSDKELFDSEHGLIAYNKNNNRGKFQRVNEVDKWIVAVGEHKGCIASSLWIQVQNQLNSNSKLTYRQPKKSKALLSGIVRCACCGAAMRPKGSRTAKDGTYRYSYTCEMKEKSHGGICQMPNIPGNQLDSMIVDEILKLRSQIITEYDFLREKLDELEMDNFKQSENQLLQKQLKSNQMQIDNLLNTLSKTTNEMTINTILERVDKINEEQSTLQNRLEELEKEKTKEVGLQPAKLLAKNLIQMDINSFKKLPILSQKNILSEVIKEIIWDGENAEVHFWAEDLPEVKSA